MWINIPIWESASELILEISQFHVEVHIVPVEDELSLVPEKESLEQEWTYTCMSSNQIVHRLATQRLTYSETCKFIR